MKEPQKASNVVFSSADIRVKHIVVLSREMKAGDRKGQTVPYFNRYEFGNNSGFAFNIEASLSIEPVKKTNDDFMSVKIAPSDFSVLVQKLEEISGFFEANRDKYFVYDDQGMLLSANPPKMPCIVQTMYDYLSFEPYVILDSETEAKHEGVKVATGKGYMGSLTSYEFYHMRLMLIGVLQNFYLSSLSLTTLSHQHIVSSKNRNT